MTSLDFDWLVIGGVNSSQAWFQGIATLTVDGVTTTNPFSVTAIDGGKLSPTRSDNLLLKVYSPGADPASSSPIYQATGSMTSANSVKI